MCRNNTCLATIAISLVIGILAGIVFFGALLPGIVTIIIIGLLLATVSIFAILLIKGRKEELCLCEYGTCLVIGIFGTIVTGIIALSLVLLTGSILFAVLIGLFGVFLVLTLLNLALILLCVVRTNCSCGYCSKE